MSKLGPRRFPTEFSPLTAILLSLPLLIMVSVWFGPSMWRVFSDALGLDVEALMVRSRWSVRDLIAWIFAQFLFSPITVFYCLRTKGHDLARRLWLTLHV